MGEASYVKSVVEPQTEKWIIETIVITAYSRLYNNWENDIKKYLKDQRVWNGLLDDFDWDIGDFETPERVGNILLSFNVVVSMDTIEKIRTSSVRTFEEYYSGCKDVEKFWNILNEFETFRL